MYRSLKVLDGGVGVFCGSGGVEPQSETNWRYANESKVARIIFINKLDRVGADFYRVVDQIKDVLNANPLVMVLPIGIEDKFTGCVDLLTRKAWTWTDDMDPTSYTLEDVPEDMGDLVEEWREKLVEMAVEQDDELLEQYLEGNEPSLEDLKRCIRKGTHWPLLLPHLLWIRFQEQRRTDRTRCGGGLPAGSHRSHTPA